MERDVKKPINYLDLFSGIGGFRLGFIEAGFDFAWTGHSEIDKFPNQIYNKHWPESEDLGDVKEIRPESLPRIDFITFGFPCQDLSIAGRKRGFDGTRSSLFFEALRIIRATKPEVFIFENVKGLFSTNKGRDFKTILEAIADLGLYECEWQLLNTRWFLPQNRERIYFIGYLRGSGRPKVFPFREDDFKFDETQEETQGEGSRIRGKCASSLGVGGSFKERNLIANTMSHRYHKDGSENLIQIGIIGKDSEATKVYDLEGCARTIKNGGGMGAKTGLYRVHTLQPRSPNRPSIRNKTSSGGSGPLSRDDGNTYCLDSGNCQAVEIKSNIRRLTPVECARLQGFPDNWCEGKYGGGCSV
jgi:DNA (cytosine-5)-methyltransferase 1